jgi:hypothetical protein
VFWVAANGDEIEVCYGRRFVPFVRFLPISPIGAVGVHIPASPWFLMVIRFFFLLRRLRRDMDDVSFASIFAFEYSDDSYLDR